MLQVVVSLYSRTVEYRVKACKEAPRRFNPIFASPSNRLAANPSKSSNSDWKKHSLNRPCSPWTLPVQIPLWILAVYWIRQRYSRYGAVTKRFASSMASSAPSNKGKPVFAVRVIAPPWSHRLRAWDCVAICACFNNKQCHKFCKSCLSGRASSASMAALWSKATSAGWLIESGQNCRVMSLTGNIQAGFFVLLQVSPKCAAQASNLSITSSTVIRSITPGLSILVPQAISFAGLPRYLSDASLYLSTHQRRSE